MLLLSMKKYASSSQINFNKILTMFTLSFKNLLPLQIITDMMVSFTWFHSRHSFFIYPISFAIFSGVELMPLRSVHPP